MKKDKILFYFISTYLLLFSMLGQMWITKLFLLEMIPSGVWFEPLLAAVWGLSAFYIPILCLIKIVPIKHNKAQKAENSARSAIMCNKSKRVIRLAWPQIVKIEEITHDDD
jgi:hypothetical protein